MAGEIKGIKTKDGITRKIDWSAIANQPFGAYEDVELISERSCTVENNIIALDGLDMTPFLDIELGDTCFLAVDDDVYELVAVYTDGRMTLSMTTFNRAINSTVCVVPGLSESYADISILGYSDGSHTVSLVHRKTSRVPDSYLGFVLRGSAIEAVQMSETIFDGDVAFDVIGGSSEK